METWRVEHYVTHDGLSDPVLDWLRRLRDNRARVAIVRRLARLEQGQFGDHRFCRDGVWELRIDFGPGYRVYYARAGSRLVLLLCAGDKRTQSTDIDSAVRHWNDWQARDDDEEQTP